MAVLGPLAFNVPVASFVAQVQAILNIEDSLRGELTEVTAPTLVLCGSQDVLTTQGDSEEIASLIPGAELAVVRGGAHLFMVEQAGAFNRTVVDFLDEVDAPGRRRPGPPREVDRRATDGPAGRRRSLDPVVQRVADELLLPVEVELGQDVPDVVLHRLLGDEQLLADLPVGVAPRHVLEDLRSRSDRAWVPPEPLCIRRNSPSTSAARLGLNTGSPWAAW